LRIIKENQPYFRMKNHRTAAVRDDVPIVRTLLGICYEVNLSRLAMKKHLIA